MDSAVPMPIDVKRTISQLINLDVLIELVKERPVIWDRSVDGYRNKEYCAFAWEEIYRTIFEEYDDWSEEHKIFVGKLIKQKWTTARDVWQRTYKKRKEAIQNGEIVSDMKDSARYEALKFLAKVYDKMDHQQSGNEDKILDTNVVNIENPQSPQVDHNGEDFTNTDDAEFQRNILSILMKHTKSQKHGRNISVQKRKLENNFETKAQVRNEQGTSSHKTVVVNFDDSFKVGNLISATKRRASSADNREAGKSTFSHIQSPKYEQTTNTPLKEETPLYSNHRLVMNNPDQSPRKLESRSPIQIFKEEDISMPSISSDINTISEVQNMNGPKRKINETTVEQASRKRTAHSENTCNSQLDHFLQVLKPRIEDFNQSQMMDFFFEILKPLIKDFDKHQLLDFQIEALQLVRKIEGDEAR